MGLGVLKGLHKSSKRSVYLKYTDNYSGTQCSEMNRLLDLVSRLRLQS